MSTPVGSAERAAGASTPTELEILNLWKDISPSGAFQAGVEECASRFFPSSEEAVRESLKQIEDLQRKTQNPLERKFLAALRRSLLFDEPQTIAGEALSAFFDHLSREGIDADHLGSLADSVSRALAAFQTRTQGRDWPIPIRVLALLRSGGLIKFLEALKKESADRELTAKLTRLEKTLQEYRKGLSIEGIRDGTFDEVFPIFKARKVEMGRSGSYATFLKEAFDFPETPQELESRATAWLDRDLAALRGATEELARIHKVRPHPQEVQEAIKGSASLKPSDLVPFIKELREKLSPWIHKKLVRINPDYDTRVIETPTYLTPMIPSGAISAYNFVSGSPFQVFFVTADPRRDPPVGIGSLLQLILHEEYGHAVQYSNSARRYISHPPLVSLLSSTLMSPITEGFAYYLEKEMMHLLHELVAGSDPTKEGKELAAYLTSLADLKRIDLEHRFVTLDWAVTRNLRVIGDVRINSGSQCLTDFIEEASSRTGLSQGRIYHQLFPAHQAVPGYATCYAVVGERIRELKESARKRSRDSVDFNTYASGIGFPARTLYEERLASPP